MGLASNKTLILSGDDIELIIREIGIHQIMDELIKALKESILLFNAKKTTIPTRDGFNYFGPTPGLIEWMPLHEHDEGVMIKVVGYHPKNPTSYQLPTILSTFSAYDTKTGHLLGLVDGVLLTALRTGAASAVASMYLASPKSKTLGLIGCGAQSITQVHALSRCFDLEEVLIYDVDEQALESFVLRCAPLNLSVTIKKSSIAQIVAQSDILCTATSIDVGAGPLFDHLPSKNHLHINAVGSDFPGKVEIPLDFLETAFVCPDFTEQAMIEGECQRLSQENIGPDWVEVIQHGKQYQQVKSQRSVFDSTGWPLEDKVAMDLMMHYAKKLELGREIQIENIPDDAKSPYHFMHESLAAIKP